MSFKIFLKSLVTFLYYFVFVAIGFFFSPFLIAKGMNPITIGYLTSLGLGLMIIAYLILGIISDIITSNKVVIVINLFLTFLVFLVLVFSNNFIILSFTYILSYVLFMVLAPILDGFILNDINPKYYTRVRACGSLGAAVSFFINTFYLNTTYTNLIIINIFILIVMFFILLPFSENYKKKRKVSLKNSINILTSNKQLLFIYIIAFLTYGTLKADDAYQYIYYTEYAMLLPITVSIVGALSMFSESFVMVLFYFFKKMRQKTILIIAITSLLIIDLSKFLFYDIKVIVCLGYIFIGLFIGLFVPIAIITINNSSEEKIRNTSLVLYQMTISLGGVILGFLTTTFLKQNGFLPNIYLLHSIIIFIALIFATLFFKKESSK